MLFPAQGRPSARAAKRFLAVLAAVLLTSAARRASAAAEGYYRYPSILGDRVVFTSEGDLWSVSAEGGLATRITSHPANEVLPTRPRSTSARDRPGVTRRTSSTPFPSRAASP
jgi:hypothetical protein